ncbi:MULTISPECIES: diacylglycerol kinase [Vibrio]|uniref:Diacylglycerol kinase n=2 Tax=Vibrio TaxID=662 RepID=A0A7X4LN88_9VIBR|nr:MULTISPECIES: diacylglycerol kinase [Vibrio]MBF8999713.1 diacylglycerol kinase [Vibrio nitrifigilis]MZI94910.1 diacylglycerol kinase [Vibrio eleionomae]
MKPGNTGIKRVVKAAYFSYLGIKAAWVHEAAFRQESLAFVVCTIIALMTNESVTYKILMVGVMVLVLIVELLNSAVEAAIDRIGPEHHELSGRAKDLGSAAVLISILFAMGVWGAILLA